MTKPTFAVTAPTDLIALAPLVLGFHPKDSVVLLSFGGRDRFHARINMPVTAEERKQVVEALVSPVHRHQVDQVAVVIFSADARAALGVARPLSRRLLAAGTDLVDIVRADGQCYDFPLHPQPEPVPYNVSDHPFVAEAVLLGRQILASREALADRLLGGDDARREAIRTAAIAAAGRRRDPKGDGRWLRALSRRADAGEVALSAEEAGRVLTLIGDDRMREVILQEVLDKSANEVADVELSRLEDFWVDLVRQSPEELSAPAAAVLAFTAWQAGDGALAWCAVERCLAQEPEHTLAQLVADCLQQAIPPARVSGNPDTVRTIVGEDPESLAGRSD